MEHDVIILGAGPAGLAAASLLAKAGHRTLLVYSGSLGGQLPNLEWINDYPEVGQRTEGPLAAAALVADAEANGVAMLEGEVEEIEAYSTCHAVTLTGGKTMTCSVVIVAGGLAEKKLGVPGEAEYHDRGMIHCAACDASLYSGQSLAVCGGGTSGAIEALQLARFASKVYLVERADALTAPPKLRDRLISEPRIEVCLGQRPLEVVGNGAVRGLKVVEIATSETRTLEVSGVLARVGFEPRCAYLESHADVDQDGRIRVDEAMRTRTPGILAAGDIRSGAPRRVRSAIADAQLAAASADALLDGST